MKRYRILGILLLLLLIISSVSFSEETDAYTLMIYLNGSDLESTYDRSTNSYAGNATMDLNEMIAGYDGLGEINVIVQTGGTKKWANDYVDPTKTQRFELRNGQFTEVDALSPQNMGYKKTLSDFIIWGTRNYPADKYALVLWNHGAGPVGGYGVDELSDFDGLGLEELRGALTTAKDKTDMTFELLGFDACLMASVEVADTIKDFSKYLVASEELEPGHGWDYTAILNTLKLNPNMDGATLGKTIADTYLNHAKINQTESDVTLSVIDLSKITPVVTALETLVLEADTQLIDDLFFYEFARSALAAKSFGGNTETQGFTDLVDVNDFANGLMQYQELNAGTLASAVNNAVIYKVDGPFSFNTSGLSIYFPYRDRENYANNMATYTKTGFSPPYQAFLKKFKESVDTRHGDGQIEFVVNEPTEDYPYYELVISEDDFDKVYYVYIDIYTEPMIETEAEYDDQYLGFDFLVRYDEESNSYFDDFTYDWTFLDSEPLMMFVTNDYGDVVDYESPVLYNGEHMNLLYAWITEFSETDEDLSHYEIYGLRRGIDPVTNMPDKNLYQLEVGATINPIYIMSNYDTGIESEVPGNPVVVSSTTSLEFEELPAEDYILQFRFTDFGFIHYLTDYYYFN